MKKIVVVTRSMSSGGAERVISEFVNYAAGQNISCSIIMMDNDEVFYKIDDSVEIMCIGNLSSNKILNRILKYKKLRNLATGINPDVVLAMPEDIGIYVIPAMLGSNIPVVVSERNNPWVMPYSKVSRLLRRIFYPFADGFIFQTKMAASFFSNNIQKKGIVLPNPLDLSHIPEPFPDERQKTIVAAGRLEKQKNFHLLIDAFEMFCNIHPEYSLVIYGEGNLRTEIEDYAAKKLPQNAVSIPGRDLHWLEKASKCSMFVSSSDYEGMPNALIEAMASGIPSISTDCPSGGSADVIDNAENGILVPVGDRLAMFKAMKEIAENSAFSDKLSKNALKIKERLNSEIVCSEWIMYLKGKCKNDKLNQ